MARMVTRVLASLACARPWLLENMWHFGYYFGSERNLRNIEYSCHSRRNCWLLLIVWNLPCSSPAGAIIFLSPRRTCSQTWLIDTPFYHTLHYISYQATHWDSILVWYLVFFCVHQLCFTQFSTSNACGRNNCSKHSTLLCFRSRLTTALQTRNKGRVSHPRGFSLLE